MTRIRVVTWNAEGMFVEGTKTRRATPHNAIATLKKLDADIVVVPEFGRLEDLEQRIDNAIGSLGYEVILVPYDDDSLSDNDASGMAVLSRIPVVQTRLHKFGGVRNAVELHVQLGARQVRIYGLHLDDKREETRMLQVKDLAQSIATHPQLPTLVLGDMNAMYRGAAFARVSRSRMVKRASQRVRHEQLLAIALRLQEMAIGTTIEFIEHHTPLHNLDPKHKLTISGRQAGLEWMPSIRLAKIDWIFGSHHFKVLRYRVYRDVGSDHRPVIADIEV
ncbi:MAG: endonuclease/exonuclease/phosphatase family protein [Candidatus Saccharimonas sp.]